MCAHQWPYKTSRYPNCIFDSPCCLNFLPCCSLLLQLLPLPPSISLEIRRWQRLALLTVIRPVRLPSTVVVAYIETAFVGWGAYLTNYISLTVVNSAIAGRSARSYTREGRFTTLANTVKSGDYVVIEFGHNDGGTLTPTDNGRSDCAVGSAGYATTCSTTYKYVLFDTGRRSTTHILISVVLRRLF